MKSLKNLVVIAGAIIASSFVIACTSNETGGNQKYQIIHQANGKMIEYDTVIPMSSKYTPEQFLADKGISAEGAEIIEMPTLPDGKSDEKTIVRKIENDGDQNDEKIEINVEVDENGKMTTKKTVNGIEVELTDEELKEIQNNKNHKEKKVVTYLDDDKIGDNNERVEIDVQIDDSGKKIIKKTVNGKEVKLSKEELDDIHSHEMSKGGDEDIEIIKRDMDLKSVEKGHSVKVTSDGENQRVMIKSTDENEDFTVVLVTKNYDEKTAKHTKMMLEQSTEETSTSPNSNDGMFKIHFENEEKKKTRVKVSDATGKAVFEEDLGQFSGTYNKEVDLKKFGSGLYTITIEKGNEKDVLEVMIN